MTSSRRCSLLCVAFQSASWTIRSRSNASHSNEVSLRQVTVSAVVTFRAEEATFNDNERGRYSAICQSFASEFIPFVDRCLRVLFPSSAFAQSLGANSAELQNIVSWKNFHTTSSRHTEIVENLNFLHRNECVR